ncbi:hypothetical protein LSAT2_028709 [Lamellibrachia satsuma]|nr:hypothetical protein LSAT2_028709 [Lamellibrachia satsuma]
MALKTVCALCGFVLYAEYHDCDPLTRPNERINRDQEIITITIVIVIIITITIIITIIIIIIIATIIPIITILAITIISITIITITAIIIIIIIITILVSITTSIISITNIIIIITTIIIIIVYHAAARLYGMISGPTVGLFILAMANPWSNTKGAYAGFIVGLIATLWLGMGAFIYRPSVYRPPVSLDGCSNANDSFTDVTSMYLNYSTSTAAVSRPVPEDRAGYLSFYETSYLWYGLFGILIVNIVGTVVSALTGAADPKKVDPRLLTPLVESFCCCLPAKFRRAIQFNIDRTQVFNSTEHMSIRSVAEVFRTVMVLTACVCTQ